jgi:hypothetical protein
LSSTLFSWVRNSRQNLDQILFSPFWWCQEKNEATPMCYILPASQKYPTFSWPTFWFLRADKKAIIGVEFFDVDRHDMERISLSWTSAAGLN